MPGPPATQLSRHRVPSKTHGTVCADPALRAWKQRRRRCLQEYWLPSFPGASSDIDMATKMAKNMVTKYGMSKELGPMTYGENEDEVFLGRSITRQQHMSEETARKVDVEVKKIVTSSYERAKKVLTEKIDDLHKLAKALLIYETLTGDEIQNLKNTKKT